MEEDDDHSTSVSMPHSSSSSSSLSNSIEDPSTSSQVHQEEEEHNQRRDENEHEHQHQHQQHQPSVGVSYRLNITISAMVSTNMISDAWSCLFVLVTFWFFASTIVILGFYGSANILLGPNCSRLINANPLFVQSIQVQEIDDSKHGPDLFGFYEPPPLDVEISWSEKHNAIIHSISHKEWEYFLNQGSKVDISYSVNSPSSAPLSLVIAEGRESLVEWIEDPSYANTTLSWNIIHGNGMIEQEILRSTTYYIALGNLNSEEVEVQLNFTIKAVVYNTTKAYYKCSPSHHLCSLKLFLLRTNVAVLTSPGPEQGIVNYDWYVKLSYGPRWITYGVGSGLMAILMLLASRVCNMFRIIRGDGAGFRAGEMRSERAPLLSQKDDDLSSWGSSYDSISHDEEEPDECLAVASLDGKQLKEEESSNNHRRLCVLCFDALRDCFFLPCGHCAACLACGTRVIEEAGICPICRRTMKKVRKIFTV